MSECCLALCGQQDLGVARGGGHSLDLLLNLYLWDIGTQVQPGCASRLQGARALAHLRLPSSLLSLCSPTCCHPGHDCQWRWGRGAACPAGKLWLRADLQAGRGADHRHWKRYPSTYEYLVSVVSTSRSITTSYCQIIYCSWYIGSLGMGGATKSNEFLEKFHTAFDPSPPPHFWKILIQFFLWQIWLHICEELWWPDSMKCMPSSKCVLFWFLSDPGPIIVYSCQ